MRLLVIGAGGHAKVVVSAAVEAGWEIAGVVDESAESRGVMGLPVWPSADGIDADAFIIAIGDNRLRAERYGHYVKTAMVAASIIHPRATVDASAQIDPGVVVFAGAVVNAEGIIGANVILNTGCTVDHDCVIGAHAHVGPGANLCGGVTVGEGALIGVGSCATPLASIGAWSTVGAGSSVIDRVEDGETAVGSPARGISA